MKKKIKAFTIIETLVTILAVSIMIAGPITFVARSFEYSRFMRAKVFSASLSQEGLELVTSMRNQMTDANFVSAVSVCSSACAVDWDGVTDSPTLTPCSGASCKLYTNIAETDSLFSHRSAYTIPTEYFREIQITNNGTGSYTVKAKVYTDGTISKIPIDVTLEKTLFLFNK